MRGRRFRRITYFPDRPDVLTVTRRVSRLPKGALPVLLSNGNPVEHGDLPGGRHFAVWPIPSPILLSLRAGGRRSRPYRDEFTTMSGRRSRCALCRARQRAPRALCDGQPEAPMRWTRKPTAVNTISTFHDRCRVGVQFRSMENKAQHFQRQGPTCESGDRDG